MASFKDVLESQKRNPPAHDERIAAFAEAIADGLNTPGEIHDFFDELFTIRQDIGSSHLATKTLRAAQKQLFRVHPEYPRAFLTPDVWRNALDWIFDDPYRAGEFTVDIWARPLQSNVSDRYKGLKAFGALAQRLGRLGTFSVLDIGCSQNAGLNHLASGVGFGMPAVVRPGSPKHKPSLKHTAAMHQMLTSDVPLEHGVGIDMYHPSDSRSWAWSCSHYPSELLDEERVALFDALINAEYDNVEFFQGNFADFDHGRFEQQYPKQKFGVVNFSTVLYQADQTDRETMLANASRYAEEFVVVQDFLRVDSDNPHNLIFRDNWQDDLFPYQTVARDMREDNGRWHEIFKWRDGRCRELAIGMGRIAVGSGYRASIWSALDTAY